MYGFIQKIEMLTAAKLLPVVFFKELVFTKYFCLSIFSSMLSPLTLVEMQVKNSRRLIEY